MAPKVKKIVRRRRHAYAGDKFYVGCRQLDSILINETSVNPLIGTFAEAEKRAQESVNKDGATRYIVRIVAKVERIAPPVRTTAL